ncbi:16S rRNA (uracil1498-N3)-methyltransferase [Aequitasia blattaphilus]|uniref:Ribosomal RNA small subunit methyltransferase E n=1 Tax=Aequitasia blattaphilus TaxID=2949332 RepID=A0ABT1E7H6_9FIRM|nr:16S rRNA (uracil(1498)-N(3))-methyltransferase [Aequitasia blattaphilus]MCP1101780.1 16S rRNA (uracil(1498)-N(3))-methyltransferase [Aequitasia blattaphilus]MCR8614420.1 16S rRNA (uracil(1498)-N(3))-methyltransferase [Aequitasia blattaphilus]
MNHFFVKPSQVEGKEINIFMPDVKHIAHVLRMREGEELSVSDETFFYLCQIKEIEKERVSCVILEKKEIDTEAGAEFVLFQGLPKGDKMDLIVQKAVELGVAKIIPLKTRRAVVRLDEKKAKKKQNRWQEIAKGAAKQSKRGYIPEVLEPMSFKEGINYAQALDRNLVPYEEATDIEETKEVFRSLVRGQKIGIFIGPEGGFEEEEIEMLKEIHGEVITLGKRILRTETAGLMVLSVLMFSLEGEA